ncbi:hypothetical protein ACN261_15145 [Micromonospora sp. WMMD723]|uniref:hypothetical protein n=1 Tax=Micromonospora sp. WMMD723 TaxID=3403465 RepID=UPI003CEC7756
MTDSEKYQAIEEALRRQVEEAVRLLDETAPRAEAADDRTADPLTEVREGLREAAKLTESVGKGGGEAAAGLAADKLIVARRQLAAILTVAGIPVKFTLVDLDYHHVAGRVEERAEATTDDGRRLVASPTFADDAKYYFPGGTVAGRLIPGGWYSIPWWREVRLVAAAGGTGLVLGVLAHEFFDKVLADLPTTPKGESWLIGTGSTGRGSVDWWPFDGDPFDVFF